MDFFSGKNPDLIGPTMKTTFDNIINMPVAHNSTISEKITFSLSNFYNDYICDNMFSVICIIILFVCLAYRYYTKNNNIHTDKTVKEHFARVPNTNTNLLEDIKNYNAGEQECDARHVSGDKPYDGHLYMNPLEGIDKQTNKLEV